MYGTEMAVGNIVKRVLHIVRVEDLSAVTSDVNGLNLSAETDDEDIAERDSDHVASAAAVGYGSILDRPSLHTLLDNMGRDSGEKGKCFYPVRRISKILLNLCGMMLKTVDMLG